MLPSRGELARQAAGMGRQVAAARHDPVAALIDERSQSDSEENPEQGAA